MLNPIFDLELSTGHVAQAVAGLALLGLFFGWLALAIGAATGNHGLAVALPAGLAAGGYLVSGLHSLAGWLDPVRVLSAFWWIGTSPLQNGIRGAGALVLAFAATAALTTGAILVGRRDLEVPVAAREGKAAQLGLAPSGGASPKPLQPRRWRGRSATTTEKPPSAGLSDEAYRDRPVTPCLQSMNARKAATHGSHWSTGVVAPSALLRA